MNANPKSPNRKLFLWPAGSILLGILTVHFLAANPSWTPRIPLSIGTIAWFADMALVLILWAHPIGARVGVLMAGLFLAVPCFLRAPPLLRFALMCGMLLPLVVAATPVLAPSITGFRARLAFMCSWIRTREVKCRARSFDTPSLLQLILATMVCAAAITAVINVPASGLCLLVRWLAGGIMILAFAEMVTAWHNFLTALMGVTSPSLMQSPWLSASVSEFWNKRWNPGTSVLFRKFFFEPLARFNPTIALFAVFALSGIAHALLFYMAMVKWKISIINGLFFLVQPLFIIAERRLNVRRWRPAAGRAWTLAILAITSPLFVEPVLQVTESSWGSPGSALPPTFVLLGVVIVLESLFSLAALVSCSGDGCKTLAPA